MFAIHRKSKKKHGKEMAETELWRKAKKIRLEKERVRESIVAIRGFVLIHFKIFGINRICVRQSMAITLYL